MVVSLFIIPNGLVLAGWEWQNPLPQGNKFNGVWGSSATDVFTVGDYGTIYHYNGTIWTPMDSGTTTNL